MSLAGGLPCRGCRAAGIQTRPARGRRWEPRLMQQRVSGVDAKFSLAWLLQPLTVETFLNEIWGADHYHLKRNCPGYFDGLLDGSATVEELLEIFRPDLALVRLVR